MQSKYSESQENLVKRSKLEKRGIRNKTLESKSGEVISFDFIHKFEQVVTSYKYFNDNNEINDNIGFIKVVVVLLQADPEVG